MSEIESCPRRWAFRNAHYPDIWDGRGFPERPSLPALRGRVVHKSLELIVRALVDARCRSLEDLTTIDVLRDLGGFTKVIQTSIKRELDRYRDNPRATPILGHLNGQLHAIRAELRTDTQTLLAQSGFQGNDRAVERTSRGETKGRFPLVHGVYSEVDLVDESNAWTGVADMMVISEECCEIRDYKSGQPKDTDHLQLQIYAWIWSQDHVRNPDKRLADKLTLVYLSGPVDVPVPNTDELELMSKQLSDRAAKIAVDLSADPPPIRPNEQVCKYCQVRQLCQGYWDSLENFGEATIGSRLVDVQLTIEGRRGPNTWDVQIHSGPAGVRRGSAILADPKGAFEFNDVASMRMLTASYAEPELDDLDPDTPVVTVGRYSEVFLVS